MKNQIINDLYNIFLDKDSGLFYSSTKDNFIHSYINGNIIWILYLIGEKEKARKLFFNSFNSKLYDNKSGLFRYSIKNGEIFNSDKNLGVNINYLYSAILLNEKDKGKELLSKITKTFYCKHKKIYFRSTVDNKLFLAHPNLWLVKVLYLIKKDKEAYRLYRSIISTFFNKKLNLLTSKSGLNRYKYKDVYLFPDDNALLANVSRSINLKFSKKIVTHLFISNLFNKKQGLFIRKINLTKKQMYDSNSIYKNSFCFYLLKDFNDCNIKVFKNNLFNNLFNIRNIKLSKKHPDSLFFGLLAYYSK